MFAVLAYLTNLLTWKKERIEKQNGERKTNINGVLNSQDVELNSIWHVGQEGGRSGIKFEACTTWKLSTPFIIIRDIIT